MLHLLHLRHQYEVGNFQPLLDVVNLDAQQNLDELNQDVGLTCQDVGHLLHQLDVAVGVELRHQLKMDYFRDEVGVELRHLRRMDYCRGEELPESLALAQLKYLLWGPLNLFPIQLGVQHYFQQLRVLAQLLVPLGQRQVRRLIQLLALD
jgi:hypothetical protein